MLYQLLSLTILAIQINERTILGAREIQTAVQLVLPIPKPAQQKQQFSNPINSGLLNAAERVSIMPKDFGDGGAFPEGSVKNDDVTIASGGVLPDELVKPAHSERSVKKDDAINPIIASGGVLPESVTIASGGVLPEGVTIAQGGVLPEETIAQGGVLPYESIKPDDVTITNSGVLPYELVNPDDVTIASGGVLPDELSSLLKGVTIASGGVLPDIKYGQQQQKITKEPGSIRFLFDGDRIAPESTPMDLGMEDEDGQQQQIFHSTNYGHENNFMPAVSIMPKDIQSIQLEEGLSIMPKDIQSIQLTDGISIMPKDIQSIVLAEGVSIMLKNIQTAERKNATALYGFGG